MTELEVSNYNRTMEINNQVFGEKRQQIADTLHELLVVEGIIVRLPRDLSHVKARSMTMSVEVC
jgi:hypothetical protein